MFLGYSYFVTPIKRSVVLSYIIGVALCIFSYEFHKSMGLALIAIPFAFIKWNRWTMPVAIILFFPILSAFVNTSMVDYILNRDLLEEGVQLDAFTIYMDDTGKEGGLGIILADVLQFIPFYLAIIHGFAHYKELNYGNQRVGKLTFGLLFTMVFVATSFVSRQGLVFRRLLYMSYPALISTMYYIWSQEGKTKWLKTMLCIAIIYQLYELVKRWCGRWDLNPYVL